MIARMYDAEAEHHDEQDGEEYNSEFEANESIYTDHVPTYLNFSFFPTPRARIPPAFLLR